MLKVTILKRVMPDDPSSDWEGDLYYNIMLDGKFQGYPFKKFKCDYMPGVLTECGVIPELYNRHSLGNERYYALLKYVKKEIDIKQEMKDKNLGEFDKFIDTIL